MTTATQKKIEEPKHLPVCRGQARASEGGMSQSWFSVTTAARHRWESAVKEFDEATRDCFLRDSRDPRYARACQVLEASRATYRDSVLSWYRKLLLPMQVGCCVPDEVATLLAEEWDERTKWRQEGS